MLSQAPGNGRSHTRQAQEPYRASLLPHWLTAVVLSLLKDPHFGRSHSMKKLSIISTYGNASQGLHGCPRRDHSEQLSSFSMHFLFLSPFEMGYQGKWVSSLNKSKQTNTLGLLIQVGKAKHAEQGYWTQGWKLSNKCLWNKLRSRSILLSSLLPHAYNKKSTGG